MTGDAVLLALRALECEGDGPSDIYEDDLRKRLADWCRVPTRDDGWQPAPNHNENKYYGDWPEDPASLGVSPDEFLGIDGWPDYWDTVARKALDQGNQRAGTNGVGRWPLVKALAIEGLEDFLGGFADIAARVSALRDLWEAEAHRSRRTIVVGRRGPQGRHIRKIVEFESEPLGGVIAWQIKNSRLFSVQPSPFFPDGKAALCDLLIGSSSNEAWLKWLPRLSLAGCDPRETRDLENFALDFGAKTSVSDYSLQQWRGWLSRLADWTFEEPPVKDLRGIARQRNPADNSF